MGFFSSTCAKTHLPILAAPGWVKEAPRLCRIVVVPPRGRTAELTYGGYGLTDHDIDAVKLVLASDYAGERFADLGESEADPNQGYFHSEALVAALASCAGLPSHQAYLSVLDAFEAGTEAADYALLASFGWNEEPEKNTLLTVLEYLGRKEHGLATNYYERTSGQIAWAALQLRVQDFLAGQRVAHTDLAREVVAKFALVPS